MASQRRQTDHITLTPGRRLLDTSFTHGFEGCGERIASPHPQCRDRLAPYASAERLTRPNATLVVCLGCRTAWRETTT